VHDRLEKNVAEITHQRPLPPNQQKQTKTKHSEAFVGPFDVANKAVEMLMMRRGVDVCCTTAEDAERMARYDSSVSSSSGDAG
jgi:hypothetical protein